MATLIPDVAKDSTRSERLVFDRLARDLPDEWIVLHSLGLSSHARKIWGEADFVVLSEKGIFVIEVKGGSVSCENGLWTFTSPDGRQSYSKQEGPFEQAKDALFALENSLKTEPRHQDLLCGYGVIMPFETFTQTGPEIEPGVLLDRRNFRRDLGFFIGELSTFWRNLYAERHGRTVRFPDVDDIAAVRQLLRPDVTSCFSLGSYLTSLDAELLDLTTEQIRTLRGMDNNVRTVIRGGAGTGKTVLAAERAKRLAADGQRVLYLCFNRLLAHHVETALAGYEARTNIEVRHAHGWYRELIDAAGLAARLDQAEVDDRELYGKVFPELFSEAVLKLEPEPFDAVVIDEGQDLLTLANLDAVDLMLEGGIRHGSWHLFLDPNQNIYGAIAEEAGDRLQEVGYAGYELSLNCRNTIEVAVETSMVSGIDVPTEKAVRGPDCIHFYSSGTKQLRGQVTGEIRRLLASGVSPGDIVVLSGRRLKNSSLAGIPDLAGLPLVDIAESGARSEGLHFCTMHAFKGLERKVVLAIDLYDLLDDSTCLLHYAGLSRAKMLLCVFLPSGQKDAYAERARAFGRRLTSRVGAG